MRTGKREFPDGTASSISESLKTSFRKRLRASSSLMAGDIETVRTSLPVWATAHEDDFPNELLIVLLSFRLSFWAGMFLPTFAEQTALRGRRARSHICWARQEAQT